MKTPAILIACHDANLQVINKFIMFTHFTNEQTIICTRNQEDIDKDCSQN